MTARKIFLFFLILCWAAAQAHPAAWYRWRSKIDGSVTCSQVPLGPGWERDGGPYSDSRCEKPLNTK